MKYDKEICIKFGRWLLKHADSTISVDGTYCWKYGDKEINTSELYDLYRLINNLK
jgi:hypothetical protein